MSMIVIPLSVFSKRRIRLKREAEFRKNAEEMKRKITVSQEKIQDRRDAIIAAVKAMDFARI